MYHSLNLINLGSQEKINIGRVTKNRQYFYAKYVYGLESICTNNKFECEITAMYILYQSSLIDK